MSMIESIGHGLTRWVQLLGVLSAALNVSCGNSNPEVVRDTTGATFSWTCSEDGSYNEGCTIKPLDAPPPAQCDDRKVWYSYAWGNFFEICSVFSAEPAFWGTDASLCRFVACDSDDDCPQFPDAEYACSAGLCQNVAPKRGLYQSDVVELCMADNPRPLDCHAQLDDPEVAAQFDLARESCDSFTGPCTVPADCRQP
jgi:hypothetical protein